MPNTKSKTTKKDWKKVIEKSEQKVNVLEHPEYKELQEKLDELQNQMLRTKADQENALRRAEREVANAHKYGLKKIILELLPVIDSLERGQENCTEDNEFAKKIAAGMELTHAMFLKVLEKFAVSQIDPKGQDFNPEQHEAMSIEVNPSVKPNTVVKVMQKGYLLNDRLIRPALVIVAKSS